MVSAETTRHLSPPRRVPSNRSRSAGSCSSRAARPATGLEGQGIEADNATGGNGGPSHRRRRGCRRFPGQHRTDAPWRFRRRRHPRKPPTCTHRPRSTRWPLMWRRWTRTGEPDRGAAEPENANIAEGGEIFRTNCTQCHNFAGSGRALTNGQYAPSLMNATPEQIWQAHDHRPAADAGLQQRDHHPMRTRRTSSRTWSP